MIITIFWSVIIYESNLLEFVQPGSPVKMEIKSTIVTMITQIQPGDEQTTQMGDMADAILIPHGEKGDESHEDHEMFDLHRHYEVEIDRAIGPGEGKG